MTSIVCKKQKEQEISNIWKEILSEIINGATNIVELITFLEKFFIDSYEYTDIQPLIDSFKKSLYNENENDYFMLKIRIIKKIEESQKNKNYYQIYHLFRLIIRNLIDPKQIEKIFQNNFSDELKNSSQVQFYELSDVQDIGDCNSSFKACFDAKGQFYLKKTIKANAKEIIEQEEAILQTDFSSDEYPSFIAHSE